MKASIRLMGLLLLLESQSMSGQAPSSPAPEEAVEMLLSNPHGLISTAGDEVQRVLERIRMSPEDYVPHIERLLATFGTPELLMKREGSLRYQRTIMLLREIGGAESKRILYGAFLSTVERESMAKPAGLRDVLEVNKRLLLEALGRLNDPSLIDHCLTRIETEDYATQLVMLRFLGRVGKDNPRVVKKLEAITGSLDATLARDPALRSALNELKSKN